MENNAKRPATKGMFARTIEERVFTLGIMDAEMNTAKITVAIPASTPLKKVGAVLAEKVEATHNGFSVGRIFGEEKRSTLYGMSIEDFLKYAKPLDGTEAEAEAEAEEGVAENA